MQCFHRARPRLRVAHAARVGWLTAVLVIAASCSTTTNRELPTQQDLLQDMPAWKLAVAFYTSGDANAGARELPLDVQQQTTKMMQQILDGVRNTAIKFRLVHPIPDAPRGFQMVRVAGIAASRSAAWIGHLPRAHAKLLTAGLNTLSGRWVGRQYVIFVDQAIIEGILRSSILWVANSRDLGFGDLLKTPATEKAAIQTFLSLPKIAPDAAPWAVGMVQTKFAVTLAFALSHEYGHLALGHQEFLKEAPKISPEPVPCEIRKLLETQADRFAANVAFLLGQQGFFLDNPILGTMIAVARAPGAQVPVETNGIGLGLMLGDSAFLVDTFNAIDMPAGEKCNYLSAGARLRAAERLIDRLYRLEEGQISTDALRITPH